MDDQKDVFLYIISHFGDSNKHCSPIKIGVTQNCERRLHDLKSGNPHKIDFYAVFPYRDEDKAYAAERILHKYFEEHRLSGEWFNINPQEVIPRLIIEVGRFRSWEYKEVTSTPPPPDPDSLARDGYLCLSHLYGSLVDAPGHEKIMLGQLILKAMNDRDNRKINQLLGLWGVRWERANLFENRMECLIVANHNVGLERLFAGTRWAAGGWQQALAYLGCAPSKTCRFGGVNSRGLIIPQEHWPGKVESIAFLKLTA